VAHHHIVTVEIPDDKAAAMEKDDTGAGADPCGQWRIKPGGERTLGAVYNLGRNIG